MRTGSSSVSGAWPPALLNVRKPLHVTAHDIVDFVRRLTGERQVGHCGTLDPRAEGVLPILLGRATRLAELLSGADKVYRARGTLAFSTETGDLDGPLLRQYGGAEVPRPALIQALERWTGEVLQTPHRYSAVKVGGRKLCDLNRAGVDTIAAPRRVVIHSITLLAYEFPEFTLEVHCSSGTYIRSLVEDIGRDLEAQGCALGIERLRAGHLDLATARTPFELTACAAAKTLTEALVPWPAVFPGETFVTSIDLDTRGRIRDGRTLEAAVAGTPVPGTRGHVFFMDGGRLVAVYDRDPGSPLLRPYRVFESAG